MNRIFTTLAILITIFSQSFAKNYPADSFIRIKRDTIVKPERDSVIAPPEGWQNQQIGRKNSSLRVYSPNVNNAPSLVFPTNYSSINGTSIGLYWNKNNNLGTCDYLVRVVDLTTLTALYNYANAGDNPSFGVQNLIAGHSYTISIKAVSKTDANDFAESSVYNISVPSSNVATLGLVSTTTTTFCGSNRTITINYTRSGNFNNGPIYFSSNSFYGNTFVELSDKNGSFINPTIIGSFSLTTTSGSFNVSLPSNLAFGTNYKIRLFAYSPVVVSSESVALTVGTVTDLDITNKFDVSVKYSSLALCTGSSATIKVALSDTTNTVFQWKKDGVNVASGGTYSKYTVATGGTYSASITQGTCPTITSTNSPYLYNITGNTTTNLNRLGDVIQCTGGSAILTMPYWSDNQTYQWQKNGQIISGANQRIYTATQSGVYTVKVTDGACAITATSDALTFSSSFSLTSALGASTICSTSGQTTITASPSYSPNLPNSYQWKRNGQNISGAISNYYFITQAGVYNADVSQGGCTVTSQGLEVKTSTTLDSVKIIQDPNASCSPTFASLRSSYTGLDYVTYSWAKSGTLVGSSSSYTASTDGNYTLTVAQGSCTTTSKPVSVVLNTNNFIPILYLSGNDSFAKDTVYVCTDDSHSLNIKNYPSGSSFQWYKDGLAISGATLSGYYVSQRGSYYVKITTSSCVLNSKAMFVENTFPKFALNVTNQSSNVCGNNVVKLDYLSKGIYPYNCTIWKKEGLALTTCGTYTFNVFEPGIYTASVQQGSCYAESEPISIKMGEATNAKISGNIIMASGGTAKVYITFTGSSPWTFSLSNGATITTSNNPYTYNVTPTISTTYTLTSVIGSCGTGTVSGSGIVTIGTCATPTAITTQPLSQTKCAGSSVTFSVVVTGGGTLTYQWKKDGQDISGATNLSYVISNLKTADLGNYSVEITGTCGTVLSNNALLKSVNGFVINAFATNPSYVGSALSLSAITSINNGSYAWQGPNGFTSNLQNPVITNAVVSNAGAYTVSVDNGQGCVGQAVATTNVLVPNITLGTLSNTNFCSGGAETLSFSPVITGHNYVVQISSIDGSFGTFPTSLGTGQTSPITFTTPSYSSGTTSNYVLRVVDLDDITNVSVTSAVIYFNVLTASLENSVGIAYSDICSGSSLKMFAKLNIPDNNDVVYQWKKDGSVIAGATSATYISNQTGTYVVKATKMGCGAGTSQNFYLSSTSSAQGIFSNPDQYQCSGSTVTLKSYYISESAAYEWRKDGVLINGTGASASISVTQSGLYSLLTTDANCTQSTNVSSRKLTFGNIIPTALYPNDKDTVTTCPNNTFRLSHDFGGNTDDYKGYSYQWCRNGLDLALEKNYSIYTSTSGLYSLKITQGNCSSVSSGVYVKNGGTSSKIITSPYGPKACPGKNVYLSVGGLICASYQWQKDGVDIPTFTNYYYNASQSGDYRVKINEGSIISYSNIITVSISNTPDVFLVNLTPTVTSCVASGFYYLNNFSSGDIYEWYKDNVLISGATNNSYNANSVGTYKVKVTNGACVGYSQNVVLAVGTQLSKPMLTTNLGKIICSNTYANLKSDYYPYASFVWKKNGQTISNNFDYYLKATESGSYTVTVTQGSCTATSDPLIINIGDKQQSIKTFNWNDASTWSCGTVPVITEDILINKGHTVTIPNNYTGFMKDLQLNGSLNYGTNALLKSRTN